MAENSTAWAPSAAPMIEASLAALVGMYPCRNRARVSATPPSPTPSHRIRPWVGLVMVSTTSTNGVSPPIRRSSSDPPIELAMAASPIRYVARDAPVCCPYHGALRGLSEASASTVTVTRAWSRANPASSGGYPAAVTVPPATMQWGAPSGHVGYAL